MAIKKTRNEQFYSAIKEDRVSSDLDDITEEEVDMLLQLTVDEAVELTVILKDYLEML